MKRKTLKTLYNKASQIIRRVKPNGGRRVTKIQRNEKCPCGSGLKYKFCCKK